MDWMIYGANGYTGALTAREAVARGMQPVLAGRNDAAVRALADELGLECQVFGLEDPSAVRSGIDGMGVVLHCAGPFAHTSAPMVDACLAVGAHYLDITGEIDVFAAAHARHDEAVRADVVLLPGAGFDVVPTDCVAASLAAALPAAVSLQLAFEAGGGLSPGTAKTSLERLPRGGCVRRDGELTSVPLGWKSRTVPFAHAERTAVTIPWGDVYTAWVSTGIPDIEVYLSMPPAGIRRLRRLRYLQPLLGTSWMQSLLRRRIEARVRGPDATLRAQSGASIWGEARSADGRAVSATMTTPNGYDVTVTASLGIAERLLGGDAEGGYYTPSLLMGADYAAGLPGVEFSLTA
ncbi:MAG: saccharopine dehydrogenase NADP-binding domain-containing protein [Xanthomonadales bacterium]